MLQLLPPTRDERRTILFGLIAEHLCVDRARVTPDASLADDLFADSLDLIELQLAVEDALAIRIDDDALDGIATVQQLIDLVEQKAAA